MISVTVRPNFERKPPDDCQRPLPREASLTRMPICGRTPIRCGVSRIRPQLGVLLDDRDDVAADLLGQHRRLDVLGVLEAVADDRRVVVGERHHGQQLRLRAGLEAELVRLAEVEHLFDDLPLLVHLDRVDAAVAALVLVLGDGGLKRRVDLAEPVLQDVGEADEDRQADAAQLQAIDQLLQVDGAARCPSSDAPARARRR